MSRKKAFLICILGVLGVTIVLIGMVNFNDGVKDIALAGEETAILDAIIGSKEVMLNVGVVPVEQIEEKAEVQELAPDGPEMVTERERVTLLDEKQDQLLEYFDENYMGPETYRAKSEAILEDANDLTDVEVDSGVIGGELLMLQSNGDTATAKAELVGWLTTIMRVKETGEYYVWMIFNKDTITYEMVKDGEDWKVAGISNHLKDFAPEGYQYRKGTFATFEEAVAAVKSIDPEKENPF